MLLSVICPTNRRGSALAATVDSVRAQTHTNWELIVASDGPLDPWLADARVPLEGDPRIRVLVAERRGSPGATRNAGLAAVSPESAGVAFLDHDDAFAAGWLQELSHRLAAGSAWIVAGADGAERLDDGANWPAELLTVAPMFEPARVGMRRELVDAIGPWKTQTWGLEDWDYWWRAAQVGAEPQSAAGVRNQLGTHAGQRRHAVRARYLVPIVRGPQSVVQRIAAAVASSASLRASASAALADDIARLQPALERPRHDSAVRSQLIAGRDRRGWFAGLPFPSIERAQVAMAERIYRTSFPAFTSTLEAAA
ncbi:MAG: glycosyltransferase family A protein [Patulibacter sp.]